MNSNAAIIPRPPPAGPVKSKSPTSWLAILFWLLAGGACGYFGMLYGKSLMVAVPGAKWVSLLGLAVLPLVWLLAAGFHEFGHLAGGWLGGGTFLLWMVGPFVLRRTPAGLRLAWNRSVNLLGGMAICIPLPPTPVKPRAVAVMIIGGPLASLVLAGAAYWVRLAMQGGGQPITLGRAMGMDLLAFTALLSFLLFLVTAIPSVAGGFKSDGKRVVELLRGDHRSRQEAALMVLSTANLAGLRPAEYDPALVAQVVSLGDGSLFDLYGHLTVYYYAADREDWKAAQGHLDYVIAGWQKVVPYIRDTVRCEYAWLLARRTGEAALARAWLDSAGPLDFDPATRLRAEAAVLLAEGRFSEALAKARDGLEALEKRSLSPVRNPFAGAALEGLQREARERAEVGAGR